MLFKRLMTACAVLSIVAIPVAYAATNTETDPSTSLTQVDQLEDTIIVPAWPQDIVSLPADEQVVGGDFSAGAIEGIDPALLSNVTFKGFARKTNYEGKDYGQVLVTSVARGNKEVAIASDGFSTQFDASDTDALEPSQKFTLEGSKAALLAALEALSKDDAEENEENTEPASTSESSGGSAEGSSNDEAASYTTPSELPETEDAPVTDTRISTENCALKFDFENEKAIITSKLQTFEDGAFKSETDCSETSDFYKLKKFYEAVDEINISSIPGTASPRFTWYYIDNAGEFHPVGEVQTEIDTVFKVDEDATKCTDFADFSLVPPQAVPRAALTYLNRNNSEVEARGCAPSVKEQPIPMAENKQDCTLRPAFDEGENGFMYERSMWTYMKNGVTIQAAPCADTGRKFEITKVYVKDGQHVCPFKDFNGTSVIKQFRKEITIDGVPQYVTDCTPDTSSTPVTSTLEGCENPSTWPTSNHDISLGKSYGQERFFFIDNKGQRQYVTQCQKSETTYNHDHTISKWEHHDDKLFAYPLSTITIEVPGYGPYKVVENKLLDGTSQTPYLLQGTEDVQTGQPRYEGCNAFYDTTRSKIYKRPDETIYSKPIGPGDPVGPQSVCTDANETAEYISVTFDHNAVPQGSSNWHYNATGTVNASKVFIARNVRKNPATGEIFVSAPSITGQASILSVHGGGGNVNTHSLNANATFAEYTNHDESEGGGWWYTVRAVTYGCKGTPLYGTSPTINGPKAGTFTCAWTNGAHDW